MNKINSDQKKSIPLWHIKNIQEIFSDLDTSKEGLSEEKASSRIEKYGRNEIEGEKKTPWYRLFLEQFFSLLIIILIVAAIASAIAGQPVEAIAIIVIVILAGVLGFFQEYQAGKAIETLQKLAAPTATVKRNGEQKCIPSPQLVPGDIIVLSTGDKVPADARLISSQNLKVNESALTGESHAVEKTDKSLEEDLTVGDRINLAYKGTDVTYGRGEAVVVATGMQTELGRIATLIKSTEKRKTPLQNNLDQLGKKLGIFSIILAIFISLLGIYRGNEIIEMFVWGVALAVAVIPEALPAVVTISIALGVRRMVKRRVLIRKLQAVETLGATNIICSDKTGTLTQDQMTARRIFVDGKTYDLGGSGYNPEGVIKSDGKNISEPSTEDLRFLLTAGTLCSDTVLNKSNGRWDIVGDPTEGAIIVAAKKLGIDSEEIKGSIPRINEIPFSSETKKMTTFHNTENGIIAYTKGAMEVLLYSSRYIWMNGEAKELTEEVRSRLMDAAEQMSRDALRVLGIAYKICDNDIPDKSAQEEMTFIGFIGMIDPPRPEAREAIKTCEHASIRSIMITGDHITTAVAVAKELGIARKGKSLQGQDIERMTDDELDQVTDETEVYARISPEHKLRIVSSLMKKDNIVAMTGDGVNDAPALKKADIGVAMGLKGTDVSREASEMILTDDNFASIVSAVEEGRSIFQNIRKYLAYLLSGNLGTVFALTIALLAALPMPLMAVQILFINFLMDGLIAIAIGVEPVEKGIMERVPRNVKEGILNKNTTVFIFSVGVWIGITCLGLFIYILDQGAAAEEATSIFFATLIFSRLFNGLNCRSFELSIFRMDFLGNKPLIIGILASIIMTLLVIYLPVLQTPFHTVSITSSQWIMIIAVSALTLIGVEVWKWLRPVKLTWNSI
ncbi:MAG: cation-translocating P-type ATPase [Desulfobia sp.]